jgi:uncharacterized protein YkwD
VTGIRNGTAPKNAFVFRVRARRRSERFAPDSSDGGRRTADGSTIGGDAVRRAPENPVTALMNRVRVMRGRGFLIDDERPRTFARAHSADTVRLGPVVHIAPDGTSPAERMLAVGLPLPGSENITFGQPMPERVVIDRMNSPPHRRDITHREFHVIGVGVFVTTWGLMRTQNFGYP